MGRFTKVSKAAASASSAYFIEGHHDVTVEAIKAFTGEKGLTFVAECTCDASTNPKMTVGGTYAMVLLLEDPKHKSAPGNLAAFMTELVPLVLDGEDYPEDPDEREEILEAFTDETKNPAKGTKMRVEAWIVKTKSGGDFTKLRWGPPKAAKAA